MMRKAAFLLFIALAVVLTLPAPGMAGAQEKALYCTKEVCSAARAECRQWCPFPCAMVFECNFPSCGSCISCSC